LWGTRTEASSANFRLRTPTDSVTLRTG